MVSVTSGYKITIGVIALLIGAYFLRSGLPPSAQVYSATDHQLDLAVVDGITKADNTTVATTTNIRAVVVPHHLVASEAIALGIKVLASSTPGLVVVISPDHYGRCPKMMCTTNGTYKTFFGNVSISEPDVKGLISHTEMVATSDLFIEEHGVYTIMPFIKHYLPNVVIVPIAISQRGVGDENSRAKVLSILEPFLSRKDVALVVSSDFSHYLPLSAADEMDLKTQKSFCSGDGQMILSLQNPSQSDCPLCLWILSQEALKNGFWNPVQIWHSNSATLLHDTSVEETTSHFTFIFSSTQTHDSCLSSLL